MYIKICDRILTLRIREYNRIRWEDNYIILD